jgi:hypothetical protein
VSPWRWRPAPSRAASSPSRRQAKPVTCGCSGIQSRTTGALGKSSVGRSATAGSPPWAATRSRKRSSAEPSSRRPVTRSTASAAATPVSSSAAAASCSDSSRRRPRRSPRSVSIATATSRALPIPSPSGCDMSVTRAPVRRPRASPISTHSSARPRASSGFSMNAPSPVLTSSSTCDAPPASFLLITLEAIRAGLATVAVTSRRAYSRLSAGTRSWVAAATARPIRSTWSRSSSGDRSTRKPGIDSSLSRVPPVWPSPRPDSFATWQPAAASSGATTRVVVSPTPPVECLSIVGPRRSDRSTVSPEATSTSVSATASSCVKPRRTPAMSKAAIWASSTSPAR